MTRSKLGSILLSLAIAFGMWLYVVTTVSTEGDTTFHDIPVQFEGESALEERKLMITSISDSTVDLRLSGARMYLNKLNSSNITIKVDLSKIYDVGPYQASYDEPSYPGDVPQNALNVENRNPSYITITVEKREYKEVPVTVVYSGGVPQNYLCDTDNAVLDYENIDISGPESVISQISQAVIYVDLANRTESISETFQYTLCDDEGNPVDASLVTAQVAQVRLDLTVQQYKDLDLVYTLIEGGGASAEYVNITLDTDTIRVSGSGTILEELSQIDLGVINLALIQEDCQLTFPVELPDGVINLTGMNEVTVDIDFTGLTTKEFVVEADKIRVSNVPAGLEYELVTKKLAVTLRGPTKLINQMDAQDLIVTVDLSGKEAGVVMVNASVMMADPANNAVGALGTASVSVTLREKTGAAG